MYQILSYIKFLFTSTNQHGIHSPFVYDLVTKCFYDKTNYKDYNRIKNYREVLINSKDKIERQGAEIRIGSLHMCIQGNKAGLWKRFSEDGSKGDIFSFVETATGCNKYEALEIIASHAGIIPSQYDSNRNPVSHSNRLTEAGQVETANEKTNSWIVESIVPDSASQFNPEKDLHFSLSIRLGLKFRIMKIIFYLKKASIGSKAKNLSSHFHHLDTPRIYIILGFFCQCSFLLGQHLGKVLCAYIKILGELIFKLTNSTRIALHQSESTYERNYKLVYCKQKDIFLKKSENICFAFKNIFHII